MRITKKTKQARVTKIVLQNGIKRQILILKNLSIISELSQPLSVVE